MGATTGFVQMANLAIDYDFCLAIGPSKDQSEPLRIRGRMSADSATVAYATSMFDAILIVMASQRQVTVNRAGWTIEVEGLEIG